MEQIFYGNFFPLRVKDESKVEIESKFKVENEVNKSKIAGKVKKKKVSKVERNYYVKLEVKLKVGE